MLDESVRCVTFNSSECTQKSHNIKSNCCLYLIFNSHFILKIMYYYFRMVFCVLIGIKRGNVYTLYLEIVINPICPYKAWHESRDDFSILFTSTLDTRACARRMTFGEPSCPSPPPPVKKSICFLK